MTTNTIYNVNISIKYITKNHRFPDIYWFPVLIDNINITDYYIILHNIII